LTGALAGKQVRDFCSSRSTSTGLASKSSHLAASFSRDPAIACAVNAIVGIFVSRSIGF
jgi:hypothetical protein